MKMSLKITNSLMVVAAFFFVTSAVVNGERCRTTGRNCIKKCDGEPDGDYQSCHGCSVFATCSNGLMMDDRPCNPNTLVWDDISRMCAYNSTTCQCIPYSTTVTTRSTATPTTTSKYTSKTTTELTTSSPTHGSTGHTTRRPPPTSSTPSHAESTHLIQLTTRSCILGILAFNMAYFLLAM